MIESASVVDAGRLRQPAAHALALACRGGLKGGEYTWAVAFVVPYVAVFLAFVVYPVVYGLWMGSDAEPVPGAVLRPDLPEHGGQHRPLPGASA